MSKKIYRTLISPEHRSESCIEIGFQDDSEMHPVVEIHTDDGRPRIEFNGEQDLEADLDEFIELLQKSKTFLMDS
ncbi:MAG: hypothetical protein QNJ29_07700 [Rhizobiaceae bacterium]|nr:hypothetical protein [Rhizobiaceae bacterium]